MKNKLFLFVLVILSFNIQAQVPLDSLWGVWNDENKADTIRLKALDNFIYNAFLKRKKDSTSHYAQIQFEFAKERGLTEYQADALHYLGKDCEYKGKLSEAITYYQGSFELFEEIGNKKKTARALYEIAGVYWTAGNYDIAKDYNRRSLAIAYEIEDKERQYLCLNGIAYCFYQQGHYDIAMQHVQKSLKLCEEIGNDNGIAWGLNAMGAFYSKQGDVEKSLDYYLRGLEINERIGVRLSVSNSLRNVGNTYSKLGNDEKALEFMERSLLIDEEWNDKRSLSISLSSIGFLHSKNGRNEKAMEYYQRSLVLAKEIGNKNLECESCTSIGLLQKDFGNFSQSIAECQKSYEIAIEIGSIEDQLNACECLYEANKALGEYAKALVYHEKMLVLGDSINIESLANNLQQMEFTRQIFADSLKHKEYILKTELAHQVEIVKKDRAKNIFIISGLLILFIAIGLWSRMRFTRKANARLKKEKDRAESSEQFKHQFLANMSHEIRTPMNAIKGMSDILIRREPKDNQLKYLNGIKDSSDSLLVIINDILDISKIEAGKIKLENIPFSVTEVIQNVHLIMQFKAEEKGLELKSNIKGDIPMVLGDPARLRQVILNLVNNAIKFTEKGVVTTSLRLDNHGNDIVSLLFTVSDTGIGIDTDHLKKVFNSFEQAYSDTSRKFGGTGLGLSISKKMVDLHNGNIWVESKKGKGSQFHFTIPYQRCTEKECTEDKSAKEMTSAINDQLIGLNILLVEDNAFNVMVAQEELHDAITDVNMVVAENGAIAVELLSHNSFDIVLMDVQMPVMNGYEATAAIRKLDNEKSKTPIIAMTANVLKEEVDRCFKAGMDDFIGKPFDPVDLTKKIHKLIHI